MYFRNGDSLYLLVPDFDEYQPGIIPAAVALWILAHPVLGVIQNVAAEGVIAGQVAEFVQHLVRSHVVGPGGGHWALECYLILLGRISCDALDATEFG
jgi:hypothetical protein